jgi:hypothetical protein
LDNKTIKSLEEEGCFDKTKLEYALMYNLFEYKILTNVEKMIIFGNKRPKGNHRIYTHLCVPIYKKNSIKEDNDIFSDNQKEKKDMNIFLRDYFYDEE